jgi:hypothetical protein
MLSPFQFLCLLNVISVNETLVFLRFYERSKRSQNLAWKLTALQFLKQGGISKVYF